MVGDQVPVDSSDVSLEKFIEDSSKSVEGFTGLHKEMVSMLDKSTLLVWKILRIKSLTQLIVELCKGSRNPYSFEPNMRSAFNDKLKTMKWEDVIE